MTSPTSPLLYFILLSFTLDLVFLLLHFSREFATLSEFFILFLSTVANADCKYSVDEPCLQTRTLWFCAFNMEIKGGGGFIGVTFPFCFCEKEGMPVAGSSISLTKAKG